MTLQSRAFEIFKRATDIPETEINHFLANECAQDVELRRLVEELLSVQVDASDLLPEQTSPPPIEIAEQVASPDKQLQAMIGPYKLQKKIGEGGFGVVYMATQREPVRRDVALKIIKPGMDSHEVIARFESERQALALMDHPNIARVFDAGQTEDDRPYFVMELVKGVPITEFCDKNNLNTNERLQLFVAVCNAVQHAHQKGVIHRDLKPSNIMVTLDDHPAAKVIDFGVSKAITQRLTEKTLFTQYGQMIGTPQYMSPEQAEMSGLDVDTRSDIYSLGVLLYELLTGTTPLDPERLRSAGYSEMQRIIQEDEPAKPSTRLSTLGKSLTVVCEHRQTDARRLRQTIRGDLDWIVMKALEKRRDRRYETANGLAADLKRHLNDEPVVARPPSAAYKFQKAWRRNKAVFAASAVVFGALSVGLIVSMWSLAKADKRERELARHVYLVHMADADEAFHENDFRRMRRELDACPIEQRGWEWAFLDERRVATIPLEFQGGEKPIFTRDGKRLIALGTSKGPGVSIWDASSGKRIKELVHKNATIGLAMSPEEDRLVVGARNGTLTLWNIQNLETAARIKDVHHNENRFDGMAFSPNGKLLATANVDGTLNILDGSNLAVKYSLNFTNPVRVVSFSPDNKWVGAGFQAGAEPAVLVSVDTGKVVKRFPRESAAVPVFSPAPLDETDSQWIATGDQAGFITLWKWDGQKLEEDRSWKAGGARTLAIDFTVDGSHLVSAFNDSTVNIWEVGTSRKTALASTVMESRVYWVTAHPTEHRIAIHAGGIKLWDFMAQDRSVQVTTHTTPVRSVEFSPNGRWIAAGSHPRRLGEKTGSPASVVVLDAESGKPINTIGSRIWGFDWLSDSRSLVVSPADGKHNLEVCNAFTGQTLKQFSGHADRAWPYVTGGGRTLISVAQDFAVRTWDIESGELKSEYNFKPHAKHRLEARLFDFDVSPQGRKLVVAFSNLWGMGIWDNRTESRTYLPKPPWEYVILLFTADESRLYVGGPGGELTLYDIATEKELNRFTGHSASVIALALSLDEKQIVSSDSAGRVIIWDAASAMPLVTLVGLHPDGVEHNAVVNSLDWSSDNTRIVAGKSDGTVQIWTLSAVSR